MFEIKDKVALITGASGGLGDKIARTLHAQGATLALTDRSAERMEKLKEEGYISKSPNKNRAVNFKRNSSVNIPLIGTVTAGQPIFAYENYEDYYSFPADSFHGSELFMLNVQGTSMIDAGICDGDKIVVRKQQNADNGDIVVALLDDSATVKRFYKKNGYYVLHPENETMADIVVEQVEILGKVIGLVRSF